MGSEPSSTPKLPLLFSIPPPRQSSEPSGMLTPPLQTSASVPFRWEEEPGKPRPCTDLITLPNPNTNNAPPKLPPRLVIVESRITKTPSPTTVLDGPYLGKQSIFSSASFRFSIAREEGSFQSCRWSSNSPPGPAKAHKERGFWGSLGQRTLKLKGGKKDVGGGSFVFPSSMELPGCGGGGGGGGDSDGARKVKMGRIRRNGSLSNPSHARSHLWAAIYEGFKQVIPWKSRKSKKKEGLLI